MEKKSSEDKGGKSTIPVGPEVDEGVSRSSELQARDEVLVEGLSFPGEEDGGFVIFKRSFRRTVSLEIEISQAKIKDTQFTELEFLILGYYPVVRRKCWISKIWIL
ncbi:hypothetical protein U1Q18_024763 [Sarracenia purpurea var. burkii]